jgi:hypothetical protein
MIDRAGSSGSSPTIAGARAVSYAADAPRPFLLDSGCCPAYCEQMIDEFESFEEPDTLVEIPDSFTPPPNGDPAWDDIGFIKNRWPPVATRAK